MKTTFSSIFFLLIANFGISQWHWQNPNTTACRLTGVDFLNENLGWLVGWGGTLGNTVNGGEEWTIENVDDYNSSVLFLDSLNGFIISYGGDISKTTDGGKNWITTNCGSYFLFSIKFINDQIGLIGGSYGNSARLLRTTDGGQSWNDCPEITAMFAGYIIDISTIGNNCWVGTCDFNGNMCVLRSTDTGINWQRIDLPAQNAVRAIDFVDTSNGWVTSYNTILHTTDGGNSWVIENNPISNDLELQDMKFIDANTGIIIASVYFGGTSIILRTTNGGESFDTTYYGSGELLNINFINNNIGFISGNDGLVLKTTDSGLTWFSISKGYTDELIDALFISTSLGYAVGTYGSFYKTTNRGANWIHKTIDSTFNLNSVDFINNSTGWVGGQNQTSAILLKTNDGGTSWESIILPEISNVVSIKFFTADKGWILGYDRVLYTEDGGENWDIRVFNTVFPYLRKIYMINESEGYIVGHLQLYKTLDGGENWSTILNETEELFNTVYFIDKDFGWIAGGINFSKTGTIWKTTDGGISWYTYVNAQGDGDIKDIDFVDSLNGWAVAQSGQILSTTDGGVNWNSYQVPSYVPLRAIEMLDFNNGYVFGKGGAILKFGEIPSLFNEKSSQLPVEEFISQNYPNPFNPITKIKYSVTVPTFVTIKVFDILGNEIETLVNEEKVSGNYVANFDASRLASGVYFYRIEAGDFIATKKMILLK